MIDEDKLIASHIALDPVRPEVEEARLIEHGVSVWALIGHLCGVNGDLSAVAHDYAVPPEAVEAAYRYYLRHRSPIDARISSNEPEPDEERKVA